MRAFFLSLLLALAALPARAQSPDPALLVADSVRVEGERLIATGAVEALYDGTRLNAETVVYDRATDTLRLTGPIRLTGPDGTVLVADSAALDRDFENGLLRGARLVLDEQLQLAAVEAQRVGGRYTQLSRVAATSCQVCGPNDTPLWQIRADRVIHDEIEKQIYFDHAQFRVLDVPIFYMPRLRMPDPTLERARGVLVPTLRSSTLLGFGIKVPYFIPLGPHRDITLTPYVSRITRTLEYRYRQAFRRGDIEINGAFSQDDISDEGLRGYLFTTGAFDLGRGVALSFDIETTSDDAYLSAYDYSSKDRLDSALSLTRTRPDSYSEAGIIHYQTLRDAESDATQPSIVIDLNHERRVFPARLGGELRFGARLHSHYRYSDSVTDGADADDIIDGRDVTRLAADLSWRDRWTLAGGMRAGLRLHLWADRFETRQDAGAPESASQLTPGAALELRWPFAARGSNGARYLLEPVAQLGWMGGERLAIPNDESSRVEFDEGNLLALTRFPATDRRERGATAALGLRWLREGRSGSTASLILGRVWREEPDPDLSLSSGLSGGASDLLIAAQARRPEGWDFQIRGLLDPRSAQFFKAEARAGWTTRRFDLAGSYLLLPNDPQEDRNGALSEWSVDGLYRVTKAVSTEVYGRYDVTDDRFARAGASLTWQNECVRARFSVSRRFASSTNVEPSTDFGLTVALKGFSTGGSAKESRPTCP
ncbi:LPS-assembly protein LptD [Litorisediminicola beolgyonensis]|uniref:LPS-assembly protein LptD n=1 Tax=Litorisediminicola beolgyonensis TaxID=1173614 RepID=A0ABW3ZJZ3_9RHOB